MWSGPIRAAPSEMIGKLPGVADHVALVLFALVHLDERAVFIYQMVTRSSSGR